MNHMNEIVGQRQMDSEAKDCGPCREKTQTIVQRQIHEHARELAGWRWLADAMERAPPTSAEEEALWSIISRTRRLHY